jgi:hypothetical protein
MRKFEVLFWAVAILTAPTLCHAGVVVDEQEIINQPGPNNITRNLTFMIEGDRQKSILDNGKRTIIIDLVPGMMTVLDGIHKTYVEGPFPPKRKPSIMFTDTPSTIIFRKTGAHQNIIGYSCDVYSGAGTAGRNTVSVTGCFSDSVPGATDYNNFQHEMADKVKGTRMANTSENPPGVPLTLSTTTTFGQVPPGLSAERAAKIKELLAHNQLVTSRTVSRITASSLPAESFQVPPGYQKQQPKPNVGGASTGGSTKTPRAQKVPK